MNTYKLLSNKGKDITRNESYISQFTNCLISMFNYNLPNTVNVNLLETYLHLQGVAGIMEYKGNLIECQAVPISDYDVHGICKNWLLMDNLGRELKTSAEYNTDFCLIYNVFDHTPNFNIMRYADMLSEIDLSMMFNIQRTRIAPVIACNDNTQFRQIDDILNSISKGNYKPLLKNSVDRFNDTKPLEIIDLNKPEMISLIQYLNSAHADTEKRFYSNYGININAVDKKAQLTENEINTFNSKTWILPTQMLKNRNDCLKNCDLTKNYTCKFSPVWEIEYKKFMSEIDSNENAINDSFENGVNENEENN